MQRHTPSRTSPAPRDSLEDATFRSRWQDGLVDLLGGLGVVWIGVAWSLELPWAAPVIVPLLLVLWASVRRSLVEPRIGRATLAPARRERSARASRTAVWTGLVVLAAFLGAHAFDITTLGGPRAWIRERAAALPLLLLGLMALQGALMTGLGRFVAYAAAFVGIATVATRLGLEPGPQIVIGGSVVLAVGTFRFMQFLRGHPVRTDAGEEP